MNNSRERILAPFLSSGALWCAQILLQLICIPLLVGALVCYQALMGYVVVGVWALLAAVFSGAQLLLLRVIRVMLDQYLEDDADELKKIDGLTKFNALCCIPVFGFITAIGAAKVHCLLDKYRDMGGTPMQRWLNNCRRCYCTWGLTHTIGVIFGNAFWLMMAWHDHGVVLKTLYILLSFMASWWVVSGLANYGFVTHNVALSHKVRDIDEETYKYMGIWRKSIRWNFLVYVPLLGTSALIPFCLAREVLKDLRQQDRNYLLQYIKKCKAFIRILTVGSLLPFPYLISLVVLGKFPQHPWLVIPLIIDLATTTTINFCLSLEKIVHSDMYLMDHPQRAEINELNVLSKVCAALIIFTLPIALAAIVIFMTKVTVLKRKCGIAMGWGLNWMRFFRR